MRKSWIAAACALVVCTAPLQGGMWDKVKSVVGMKELPKAPAIKVLVAKDVEGAMLEVKGKYNIYDPYKGSRMGTRFFSKSNYMQPVVEGLKWGEVFPGVFQLVLVPDDPATTIVVNGIEYRGSIFVYNIDNTISIVNEVPVEDYVHSILATQVDNGTQSKEVMAAMAIAARTDACFDVISNPSAFWHVDASKVGYLGYAITRRGGNNLDEVMASTRHLILSRTRAYQGKLEPLLTRCLEDEYRNNSEATGWNIGKAQALASKGDNAARILQSLYPEGSVEMMSSMDQVLEVPQTAKTASKQSKQSNSSEITQID